MNISYSGSEYRKFTWLKKLETQVLTEYVVRVFDLMALQTNDFSPCWFSLMRGLESAWSITNAALSVVQGAFSYQALIHYRDFSGSFVVSYIKERGKGNKVVGRYLHDSRLWLSGLKTRTERAFDCVDHSPLKRSHSHWGEFRGFVFITFGQKRLHLIRFSLSRTIDFVNSWL